MILSCPACHIRYMADEAAFPPQGRDVRCARCGHVWHASLGSEAYDTPQEQPSYESEEPEADVYAQPSARDAEPQADDTSYEESVAETATPWTQRLALTVGWAGLAAVVLVIGFVASIYRQQVVEFWPQSASFYSKLGVKVNAAGLDIRNIAYTEAPQDGQLVLTVTGALTNVTNHELPVPQIRVGLVDGEKRELYHWTFAPEVMTLRPGQSTRFVTRLSNPPTGAAHAEVQFAKAGE
jgi:predicted Zn finger-like uncharacterized protein